MSKFCQKAERMVEPNFSLKITSLLRQLDNSHIFKTITCQSTCFPRFRKSRFDRGSIEFLESIIDKRKIDNFIDNYKFQVNMCTLLILTHLF